MGFTESIGPKQLFDLAAIEKAVSVALDDEAKRAANGFRSHMATWSAKNRATVTVKRSTAFSREIRARGGKLQFVEFDTKPHIIVPKKAKALRFKSGYKRKTSGNKIPSNRGGAYGQTVYAKQVKHPGSKGTQISKQIRDKTDKTFPDRMQQRLNEVT